MSYFLSSNTYIKNTGNRPLIITEPDGSVWVRILHHGHASETLFDSCDYFDGCFVPSEDLYAYFSILNLCTKWELMIKQKATLADAETKFRWVQNVNPLSATFAQVARANVTFNTGSGYTTPGGSYGGIYRVNNAYTYICANNGTEGNWWGAIGSFNWHNGGIPGYNGVIILSGYLDLYIRTDNNSISSSDMQAILDTDTTVLNMANRAWHYNRWDSFTLNSSTIVKSGTANLTTHGRPVFIVISGDLNADSASSADIHVTRWPEGSSTGIQIRSVQINSPGSSINIPFCLSALDPVPAGSWKYTYSIEWLSGTCQFGEGSSDDAPTITIMEI